MKSCSARTDMYSVTLASDTSPLGTVNSLGADFLGVFSPTSKPGVQKAPDKSLTRPCPLPEVSALRPTWPLALCQSHVPV